MVDVPNGDLIDLSVAFKDGKGDPATKPGPVTWTSSADAVATVAAKADDTTATVTSLTVGTATITATSGAISGTVDINVIAAAATEADVSAGQPYTPPA